MIIDSLYPFLGPRLKPVHVDVAKFDEFVETKKSSSRRRKVRQGIWPPDRVRQPSPLGTKVLYDVISLLSRPDRAQTAPFAIAG
jgi:hypothetical protein